MPKIKKISHVALVVEDIEDSLTFWRDALGIELTGFKDVPSEGVKVALLPIGESELELVQPVDHDRGLFRYLEKRGPGMHHICLEVDDIEGMMGELQEKGIRLITDTPQVESGGLKYAFIHPKSTQGVLVELYEIRR